MGSTTYREISSLPPPSAFKSCLKHMEKILAYVGGANVVFVVPLPRYVTAACCKDTTHVSNRLSSELSGAEKSLIDAAAAGERTGNARFINILSFFGSCESSPQVDGGPGEHLVCDGVHLTVKATRVAARKLMSDLSSGGQGDEPANK